MGRLLLPSESFAGRFVSLSGIQKTSELKCDGNVGCCVGLDMSCPQKHVTGQSTAVKQEYVRFYNPDCRRVF